MGKAEEKEQKAKERDQKEREEERQAKEKREQKEKSISYTNGNESNMIFRIIGKGRRATKKLFGMSNAKNREEEEIEKKNKLQIKRDTSVDRTKGIIDQVETSAKDIAFFVCFQMNTEAEDKIKGYHAEKNVQLEETGKAALKVSSAKVADHKQKVNDAIALAANVTPPDIGGTPPDDNGTTIDEEDLKDGNVVEKVTEGQNSGNVNPPEKVPVSIEIPQKIEENWKIQVQKDAVRAAKDVLPTTYKLKENRATMRNAVSEEEENRQASMIDLTDFLTKNYIGQKDILHKAVAVRGSKSTSVKEKTDSELEALEDGKGNNAEDIGGNMSLAAIGMAAPGHVASFLGFDSAQYNVSDAFTEISGVGGNLKRVASGGIGAVGVIGDGMTLVNRLVDLGRHVKQKDDPLVITETALDAFGSLNSVASGLNTVISSAIMSTEAGLNTMKTASSALGVIGGSISAIRGAVQISDGILTGKAVNKGKEDLATYDKLSDKDEEAVKQLYILFEQMTRATKSDKIEGSIHAVGGVMQVAGEFIPGVGAGIALVGSIADGVGGALVDMKRAKNLETYAEQTVPWEEMEQKASAQSDGIKKLSMPDKRRTIFKFAGATYGSSTEAALIATRSIAAGLRDKNNKFVGKNMTLTAMRLKENASEEMINRRMGMNKKQAENSALALGNELKKEKERYQCKFGLFNWRF